MATGAFVAQAQLQNRECLSVLFLVLLLLRLGSSRPAIKVEQSRQFLDCESVATLRAGLFRCAFLGLSPVSMVTLMMDSNGCA